MNVNKTDNINFGNFYRLPYSAQNVVEVSNQVIPVYKLICKKNSGGNSRSCPCDNNGYI